MDNLEKTLDGLKAEKGIEIFPLSEAMLERSISLTTEKLDLKPFDNAILAAILVRAQELTKEGQSDMAFCELDGDLQPWGKHGKPVLKRLYDDAHVWVYGDFTMTTPEASLRLVSTNTVAPIFHRCLIPAWSPACIYRIRSAIAPPVFERPAFSTAPPRPMFIQP